MKRTKTRYRKAFKANGKKNLTDSKDKIGVYLIKINGVLRYVGYSGYNLYATLYRHFYAWNDPTQIRVTYEDLKDHADIKVRIVYTNTEAQAQRLERALLLHYEPIDNPHKIEAAKLSAQELNQVTEDLNWYGNAYTEAPF